MPPLLFAVAAGTGLYFGLRSLQRTRRARRFEAKTAKADKAAAAPESGGQLRWDEAAKAYRVTPRA